jgi:site-specific recombinase XerD
VGQMWGKNDGGAGLMVSKRFKTRYPGVRYREHATRKWNGHLDRYFMIRYRLEGKLKEEGLGWASKGWNAFKASEKLNELKANQRTGEGPRTLAEKRHVAQEKRLEKKRTARLEARKKITLKTYFEKIYYPIAKTNKKAESYRGEEGNYRNWLGPSLGNIPLRNIKPIHLERVKQEMIASKKAPRTIQHVFATFRQIWNMARRDDLVERESPTKHVRIPKVNNKRTRFLSEAEADSLLEELRERSLQLHHMSLLSLHTGMRFGEICKLTWKDVDRKLRFVSVRDAKGDKDRVVFLTDETREVISRLDRGKPDEYVFTDAKGKKIEQVSNAFTRAVKKLRLNEGITDRRDRVSFHTLRHTFASWHVQGGTDLYVLQKLMGHSTLTMTERYSHLGQNSLEEATRKFNHRIRQKHSKGKIIRFPKR